MVVLLSAVSSCGGSSSETPPPLEPTASERELQATPPSAATAPQTGTPEQQPAQPESSPEMAPAGQVPPGQAPATWGVPAPKSWV